MNLGAVVTFLATSMMVQFFLTGASAFGAYLGIFHHNPWGFLLAATTLAAKFLVRRMTLSSLPQSGNHP
jgi:hypothetical protein